MFLGLILILIGTIFLLRNLGLLPVEIWSVFWPSLLILLGIYLIFISQRVRTFWSRFWGGIWRKLE
jgi:uncharacterized membrane protein